MEVEKTAPPFNARAVGVILLTVLVVLLLFGAVLNSVLDYFQESPWWDFLRINSELELSGARTVILGVLDPLVMIGTTLLFLRRYYPTEDVRTIVARFGLRATISLKVALPSFLFGVAYVLLFTKVLMIAFPPPDFAAPHPANVAANTAVWAQLIFAISLATVVPIVEEFFFRGVLYKGLSVQWNKAVAAFVVSLIFIMFHPDMLRSGYWVTHMGLYVIPFILVIARDITGSLASPIMIHAGFNFTEIFF